MVDEKVVQEAQEITALTFDLVAATVVTLFPSLEPTKEAVEHFRVLIAEAALENDKAGVAFSVTLQNLLQLKLEAQRCKPFQWDTKERLEKKFHKQLFDLAGFLKPYVAWHAKWRDRAIRDKLRGAGVGP